ncbi:uncharacterized protein LOC118412651 isoform X3 [Branchiostoma floridae]|uniref:Uncharacterized protein LOC118412651 isoform X3 n=1 Tax=Branchiostoma floridae TaxID=7739 RepID=A0A9J7KXD2_BRAFL|nr:uncharacterized protein LOC118412651 isoform X3 [Branchiostoma floridae]
MEPEQEVIRQFQTLNIEMEEDQHHQNNQPPPGVHGLNNQPPPGPPPGVHGQNNQPPPWVHGLNTPWDQANEYNDEQHDYPPPKKRHVTDDTCWSCGGLGHMKWGCPSNKMKRSGARGRGGARGMGRGRRGRRGFGGNTFKFFFN